MKGQQFPTAPVTYREPAIAHTEHLRAIELALYSGHWGRPWSGTYRTRSQLKRQEAVRRNGIPMVQVRTAVLTQADGRGGSKEVEYLELVRQGQQVSIGGKAGWIAWINPQEKRAGIRLF